jgi:hypothetical protein
MNSRLGRNPESRPGQTGFVWQIGFIFYLLTFEPGATT